jgi:oligopeptide/dipeptide ABC transporter ATP-binding protein
MGPKLLLCDEPVSALDASTRNFVLGILAQLRNNSEIALLIISHDLASLAGVADRIAVLYRGRIVEQGTVEKLFSTPRHPYTALLLSSAPSLARDREVADIAPSMIARPSIPLAAGSKGCVFADRCMFASDICLSDTPQELEVEPGWSVACHNASKWRSEVGPHAFVQ